MRPQTLRDFAGDWRPSGAQLNYRECPECASTAYKVYVNPETGAWICFRCDARGRVDVPVDLGEMRARLVGRGGTGPQEWRPVYLPNNRPLSAEPFRFVTQMYGIERPGNYLLTETLDSRVLIPYLNREGDIVYYSARTYMGQEPKYVNMPGRHPLYMPAWAKAMAGLSSGLPHCEVVVVEGAFDAMKVHQETGLFAVGIGGKTLPRYLLADLLKLRPRRVRVMLDSDASAAGIRLAGQLEPYFDRVERVPVPEGLDPASMEGDELREALL